MTKRVFKGNFWKDWLFWLVCILVLILLFEPLLVNDKPLIETSHTISFPFLKNNSNVYSYPDGIWAPIPFDGKKINLSDRLMPPLSRTESGKIHLLGTDGLGRDLAAALIQSLKPSLFIGLSAMLMAFLFGSLLGILSAWFQNDFRISIISLILLIVAILVSLYFLWFRSYFGYIIYYGFALVAILIFLAFIIDYFDVLPYFLVSIPFDIIVIRFLETFRAIPALMFIFALAPILSLDHPFHLALIISLFSWPIFTRLARAKTLELKKEEFIQYAHVSSYPLSRLVRKHILSNIRDSLIITICFGVAAAIVLEASLSFLGIGGLNAKPSIGGLLSDARAHWNAWWLAVYPGLVLFCIVFLLMQFAKRIQKTSSSSFS